MLLKTILGSIVGEVMFTVNRLRLYMGLGTFLIVLTIKFEKMPFEWYHPLLAVGLILVDRLFIQRHELNAQQKTSFIFKELNKELTEIKSMIGRLNEKVNSIQGQNRYL